MSKYIGAAFVGLGLLSSVAFAFPAQAAGLTGTQIQAILSLLQSFGADQGTINNVSTALGGQATSGSTVAPSCLTLTYNLYAGMTDAQSAGQVSQLQQFLGINPTTGYFGPMTQQAVQNWQSSHGIVSSGSPDTTGYGFVGPATRTAMGCGGSSASNDNSSITFTASPSSGTAPLTVTFTTNVGNNYAIDFGNGSSAWVGNNPNGGIISACTNASGCSYTTTYTYPAQGAFTAKLISGGVTYATIIVTVTQPSAAIDQSSLTASVDSHGYEPSDFTLTGGATNASAVVIALVPSPYNGSTDYGTISNGMKDGSSIHAVGATASVSGGRWSAAFHDIPVGAYLLLVYDFTTHALLVPSGSVFVTAPAQTISATCSGSPYNSGAPGMGWSVQASGGSGSYTYQWTLSNDVAWVNPSLGGLQSYSTQVQYNSTGTKQASVVVSDGSTSVTANCSATIPGNTAPSTPTLSVDPSGGAAPLTVTFTNTLKNPTNLYTISFGDGQTATAAACYPVSCYTTNINTHTYASPNTYTATLTNSSGATISTATVTVTNPQTSASPTLSVDPSGGAAPLTVTFTTNVGNNYAIDFGNGSSAWVGNNPNGGIISACTNASGCSYTTTYTYPAQGAFTAKLISGGVTYATIIVTVTQPISSLPSCPANATAQRGMNGQTFTCTCPANFSLGPVWGGPQSQGSLPPYFTDDSNICTAGIQSGQLNQASGGELMYTIDPGQSSYSAGSYNGITSQSYGSWPGSFQITGPKG